ncbi:hypothetical protein VTG60DRAFT_1036 [Thermothelomyces hinnuleus]
MMECQPRIFKEIWSRQQKNHKRLYHRALGLHRKRTRRFTSRGFSPAVSVYRTATFQAVTMFCLELTTRVPEPCRPPLPPPSVIIIAGCFRGNGMACRTVVQRSTADCASLAGHKTETLGGYVFC